MRGLSLLPSLVFYLLIPDPVCPVVAEAFPEALRTLVRGRDDTAGPVFLQVGATFDEPTLVAYEPTDGATTDPYPSVPVVCASANVLVRESAVASAIVATFMVISFNETTPLSDRCSTKFLFNAKVTPGRSQLTEP
jgi:hypothetical protein